MPPIYFPLLSGIGVRKSLPVGIHWGALLRIPLIRRCEIRLTGRVFSKFSCPLQPFVRLYLWEAVTKILDGELEGR